MIVTVGKNITIPLPDELLEANKVKVGDILICKVIEDIRSIELEIFDDQTLSDEQIKAHGSLTRVEALNPKCFE